MSDPRTVKCAAILVTVIALGAALVPPAEASVEVQIGQVRQAALQFVQQKFGLSPAAARHVMKQYEIRHGASIIDAVQLPEGAVLDFVRVNGNAAPGEPMVTYEGSGMLRPARPQFFAPYIQRALQEATPAERARLMRNIQEAMKRGWFVQEITPEQRRNLEAYLLPGQRPARTKQATVVRILVVLNNFPHWDDVSPSPARYDAHGGDNREHPITVPPGGTPGGPLSTTNFTPNGLSNPSWDHSGIAPNGSGASTANHPRIQYDYAGRAGTSVDLRERWYDFLFNPNPIYHPYSVTNYYYANSHGKISIQGDRTDIVGPLESHHILDRIPLLGGPGNDYAIQPGTPVIRDVPGTGLRGISADSTTDTIATLGYTDRINVSNVQRWDATASPPQWRDLKITNTYPDPYDSRRLVVKVENFNENDQLRCFAGGPRTFTADVGFNLDNDQGEDASLLTEADVMQSDEGNRLLSMCYYTHDHAFDTSPAGRPYQLAHTRNSKGRIDDIGGTVDNVQDHRDRPKPYDHDTRDHTMPNMGYFEGPDSNGGHTFGVWLGHVSQVLADEGIIPTGYSRRIYLYPADATTDDYSDTGGSAGPWSGAHVFIPNSSVVLPESAGLYVTAHELGHTFGMVDLYDLDFYTNSGLRPSPPLFECNMIGPYSVMSMYGKRVDAWHKIMLGWATPIAVTEDIMRAPIPEIEGTLEQPIIYKLPGRPHYIHDGIPPNAWEEYFLIENRNRNGSAYFGDGSFPGLYIYHVDMRFGQTDEWHPMLIVEQADGLFELERNRVFNPGTMESDPFPGSLGVRNWTQLTNPSSFSHGWKGGSINSVGIKTDPPPEPPPGVLQPGTDTDSFARVANISDPGATMFADLHVVPCEVIATGHDPNGRPTSAPQGAVDVPMLRLQLNNDTNDPNLSMGDVEIVRIRIDENGSSQNDADVSRASLFDDTNGDGLFDPMVDTRIATGVFQNQTTYFTNLNYRIPLGEVRNMFFTYDIAPRATAGAGVTLGVGIAAVDYIVPKIPGAVQNRVRTARTAASSGLGSYRFPINSSLVLIDEALDTLTVTPVSRAPVAQGINPGDVDVPILSLDLSVDMDTVEINRLTVDEVGTINAVAHIPSCKLYHDRNRNGAVDAGDTLLFDTTFANVGGVQRAVFNLLTNPVLVTDAADESLLITCSISPATTLPSTLQLRLEDTTYVRLVDARDIVSPENFPMESEEVSTPLPNNPPAAPLNLTAAAQPNGSILLNWELSDDDPNKGIKAGENDVTEYHIFRSTDPAALPLMTAADVYAVVPAGSTSWTDTGVPLGVPLYYMVRAYDGVQEGPDSNIAGPVTATDNLPPVFSGFDPADGAENVPRNTNITFVIDDAGSGVDLSTLVFEVDGVDVANAPETTKTGTRGRYTVVYNPPADFDYLQTVQVRVQVADLAGNVAPGAGQFVQYQFTTEGPPTYRIGGTIRDAQGNPEANVRVSAGVLFDLTDANGVYEITGLAAGSYTVVPTKDGRSFTPVSRAVTVGPSAYGIDFVSAPGFDISGVARMAGTNDPVQGVTVSDGVHTAVTGANGRWSLQDVPAGTYTITASLEGYEITPSAHTVTVNEGTGNISGLVFQVAPESFDISGTVRTAAGAPLAGIQVQALQGGQPVATTATNLNGAYTLVGLLPGVYTVQAVHPDWSFEPQQHDINLATDQSNVDFVARGIYRMTIPAGISFLAVPVNPIDPGVAVAFGIDAQVRRWDPQSSPPYLTEASTSQVMRVRPGRGFWVRRTTQRQAEIVGEPVADSDEIVLNLERGWNMAGNPYARTLPWASVVIPNGSPARPYGFIYDEGTGGYKLVTNIPGLGAVNEVPRERGFWIKANSATQVTIQGPGAAAASADISAAPRRQPGPNNWLIPVVAQAGGRVDAASVVGVMPQADGGAYQAVNPPPLSPYVDVYFPTQGGEQRALDVRPAASGTMVWPFEVATDMAGVTVTVSLPDLSEVPAGKRVVLVDLDAGKRIYARTMPAYRYESGEGGVRHFQLEVSDGSGGGLMITAAAARPASAGATVSYTLSLPARVSVEVLNIAGRKVALLAGDQVSPAGVNSLVWNGRSTSGTLCPPGRYLVRIRAAAEDGQQVESIVPLNLSR